MVATTCKTTQPGLGYMRCFNIFLPSCHDRHESPCRVHEGKPDEVNEPPSEGQKSPLLIHCPLLTNRKANRASSRKKRPRAVASKESGTAG